MNETPPDKNIRHRLKQVPKETLAALYQSGQTLDEVGKTFGVTRQSVHRALKAHGIARREYSAASILAFSKGKYEGKTTAKLNESLFSGWSQPMAYLLGYIFTDGSLGRVSNSTYQVVISSIDRDHLDKLAAMLGKGIRIRTQKQSNRGFSGSGDRCIYSIAFTRPRTIHDLRKLGLTERKSSTLNFPPVPEEFLRDFIRGCWDGDGSIFIGSSRYPLAYFGTGSLEFIKEMRGRLAERGYGRLTIHVKKPGKAGRKNPHYHLKIHSKHAVAFCEWLYENVPTELMLMRKARVYEFWRNQHPDLVSSPVLKKKAYRVRGQQRCVNIARGHLCARPALPGEVYCGFHRARKLL